MRTFVVGDIHGACRALKQCLDRAAFDFETDKLICLGDVCDGWPETRQSIDLLLKIKSLVLLKGNHDWWTILWMTEGYANEDWLAQGGEATRQSYKKGIPKKHKELLVNAKRYYLQDSSLFVHAGINPDLSLEEQTDRTLFWDRTLAKNALQTAKAGLKKNFGAFSEIYLGHSPQPGGKPVKACNVWLMDTGAGWDGVLTIMNIETNEYFTSDPVPQLYPKAKGRSKK